MLCGSKLIAVNRIVRCTSADSGAVSGEAPLVPVASKKSGKNAPPPPNAELGGFSFFFFVVFVPTILTLLAQALSLRNGLSKHTSTRMGRIP
jgi:hypothetical protein